MTNAELASYYAALADGRANDAACLDNFANELEARNAATCFISEETHELCHRDIPKHRANAEKIRAEASMWRAYADEFTAAAAAETIAA